MSLWKAIRQAWEALAYAHQGELMAFEDKCAALGVDAPEDYPRYVPHCYRGPEQQIGLYVGAGLNADAVEFALRKCRAADAGLLLLSLHTQAKLKTLLQPYWPRIESAGVPFKLVGLDGGLGELQQCLFNHKELRYLITNNQQVMHYALLASVTPIFIASLLDL